MKEWKKTAIRQLQESGQSIIDNADKIIGGFKYQTGSIDVNICIEDGEAPTITVSQNFIPEKTVESILNRGEYAGR